MRTLIAVALAAPLALAQSDPTPPAPTHYLGRRIAKTMSFHGAPWLIRRSREQEEQTSILLKNLGVKPGMVVCDLGSGNGYLTLPLAEMVGEKGKVFAVDIQPEMLRLLEKRARKAGLEDRITPVLCTPVDPRLPAGQVDLLIMVDVHHEVSHPEHVLRAIRKSLSKTGRVVFVEFRKEDIDVPIKHLHKMSKAQVHREATANGFRRVGSFDELPQQHVLFYARDDKWKGPPPTPAPTEVTAGTVTLTSKHLKVVVGHGDAKTPAGVTAVHHDGSGNLFPGGALVLGPRPEKPPTLRRHGTRTAELLYAATAGWPVRTSIRYTVTDEAIDILVTAVHERKPWASPVALRLSNHLPGDATLRFLGRDVGSRRSTPTRWIRHLPEGPTSHRESKRSTNPRPAMVPETPLAAARSPFVFSWPFAAARAGERTALLMAERTTRQEEFRFAHTPTTQDLILLQHRHAAGDPFTFVFRLQILERGDSDSLTSAYEAWCGERVKSP
ncbi:MAG: hypothetical protein CMJ83_01105 [Planctomycetes bacterium]|nr:hypothetical protein [Planctomycetota bacterium]